MGKAIAGRAEAKTQPARWPAIAIATLTFAFLAWILVPYSCVVYLSFPPTSTCHTLAGRTYESEGSRLAPLWPPWTLPVSLVGGVAAGVSSYLAARKLSG